MDLPPRKKTRLQQEKLSPTNADMETKRALIIGAQVLVKKNDPTHIADCLGEVVGVPQHPNTWYKVKMLQDGSTGTYRPSHLEVVKKPVDSASISPILNSGADATEPPQEPSTDGNDPAEEADAELTIGCVVEIKETSNVKQRAPRMIGRVGKIAGTPDHPNTWYQVTFEGETKPFKFQATALRVVSPTNEDDTKGDTDTNGSNDAPATTPTRRPRAASTTSEGSKTASLLGETVSIVEGAGKGLSGVIKSGGNGYFYIQTDKGEFRKRRPQFNLGDDAARVANDGNTSPSSQESTTTRKSRRIAATETKSAQAEAELEKQWLNKRVLVLSTGEHGKIVEINDNDECVIQLAGDKNETAVEPLENIKLVAADDGGEEDEDEDGMSQQGDEEAAKSGGRRTSARNVGRPRNRANNSSNASGNSAPPAKGGNARGGRRRGNQNASKEEIDAARLDTHRQERAKRRAAQKHRTKSRQSRGALEAPTTRLGRILQERREHMIQYLTRVREKRNMYGKYRPDIGVYQRLVQGDPLDEDEDEYRGLVVQVHYCVWCKIEKQKATDSCWNPSCERSPIFDASLTPLHAAGIPSGRGISGADHHYAVLDSPRRKGFISVLEEEPEENNTPKDIPVENWNVADRSWSQRGGSEYDEEQDSQMDEDFGSQGSSGSLVNGEPGADETAAFEQSTRAPVFASRFVEGVRRNERGCLVSRLFAPREDGKTEFLTGGLAFTASGPELSMSANGIAEAAAGEGDTASKKGYNQILNGSRCGYFGEDVHSYRAEQDLEMSDNPHLPADSLLFQWDAYFGSQMAT